MRFRYFWPATLERLAYGGILPNLKRNRLLWILVPFFLISEFIATLRATHQFRVDVIHAHWVIPQGIVAVLVGWLTRRPVLITGHGTDINGLRGRLHCRMKRWVLERCSHITIVSRSLLDGVRALGVNQKIPVAVIPMDVDTSTFCPRQRDETLRDQLGIQGPLVLFVGRLVEEKGVRYLLEAIPTVLRDFLDATLVIVGDGPLRNELEALVRFLNIGDHVKFVGAIPQPRLSTYYATADVFVGPSVVTVSGAAESFGVVFAEALASGCPVIASDVGGIKDVVIHNLTGITVPERDPKAIADGVCIVLRDQVFREQLRDAGLRWVKERFDQQIVAYRYAEVIEEVGIISPSPMIR